MPSSRWLKARAVWLLLIVVPLCAEAAEPRRVLLLHSFGRDFEPYRTFSDTFRSELARQSPGELDFFDVALEAARFEDGRAERALLEYLGTLLGGQRLDLVVPIGGPAVRFSQKHRDKLFPGSPGLIAGVDERHIRPASLTTNDAVVPVRNEPRLILENIRRLLPGVTNVLVIFGASPVESFWVGEFQREFPSIAPRLHFEWLHGLSFEEIKRRAAAVGPGSAIFYGQMAVDASGIPHVEERALAELHAVAGAPVFGVQDYQLGRGIVGGPLMPVLELGRQAALAATRILRGAEPASIRLPPLEPVASIFDGRELKRWRIPEALLPPGSEVRFREVGVWSRYRGRIIAVASLCLVQAGLILFLMLNLARRRRAERLLRESEDRLSLTTSAGGVGVWAWDPEGRRLWATADWRRLFGFPEDGVVEFDMVMSRIHPDDREAVLLAVQASEQGLQDYRGEFRVLLPDGSERWISARGRLQAAEDGRPPRILGASVDITERKEAERAAREFGGRLITAQEEERARLSRELHDDITQRLARLAIDAGRAERGASAAESNAVLQGIREGLARLSEDVHSLAYQLHPALLEHLGLVDALKAECEQFSRREGLPVRIKLGGVPADVPRAIGLTLFRVTQESLRNVARHARARAVTVSLRLDDGVFELAITDDGVGFDPLERGHRRSLGLAGMRERVRLVGGDLEIESAPGAGTTVLAWVPLTEGTK